jgi:Na+-translocating ferredoxin:NAD+ oxidoreductase subunit B
LHELAEGDVSLAARVALIDEAECIGCALCLPACPVDAILGASGLMHTVIAAECTGCGWCVAPCPADCITLVAAPARTHGQRLELAAQYRERHDARTARLAREAARDAATRAAAREQDPAADPVAAALARVQARRATSP